VTTDTSESPASSCGPGWLDMLDGLDKIHKALVEKKWPMSYSIEWSMGGESPILFIVPFRSYAEMAEPEPP